MSLARAARVLRGVSRALAAPVLAATGMFFGTSVQADTPPDLGRYDCTRSNDGRTISGATLAARGFQIAVRARFGNVNLVLIDPKTAIRANCFLRTPSPP